jgi:hypothetical protein
VPENRTNAGEIRVSLRVDELLFLIAHHHREATEASRVGNLSLANREQARAGELEVILAMGGEGAP